MSENNLEQQLARLFRETGHAHHKAFIATDGADPEWPIWYAGYLRAKLATIFDTALTKSMLIYWLVRVDQEHVSIAPEREWQTYYARFFINHFTA
ncbi:MAG: hypothetical protein AAF564_14740 [Bacteroidota bacterium]